jgi:hypothetical protein
MFLQSTSQSDERQEFLCFTNRLKTRCTNENNLNLKLPFSWLIKDNLDELIQFKMKENNSKHDDSLINRFDSEFESNKSDKNKYLLEQLMNVFAYHCLQSSCQKFFQQENFTSLECTQFSEMYLNDFLMYNFSFINEIHLNVVRKRFTAYCGSHFKNVPKYNVNYLLCIHLAYDLELKQELILFDKFVSLGSKKILEILSKSETNENLCFSASKILINEFKQKVSSEMNESDWKLWSSNVENVSQIIEAYLNSFSHLDEIDSDLKSLWQRCILIKLFVQHICPLNNLIYKRCVTLWNFFTPDAGQTAQKIDLKSGDTFSKLIKFLNMLLKLINSNKRKKCEGCDSFDYEFLTMTDCQSKKCELCQKCMQELISLKKCPKCSEKFDDFDLDLKKIQKNKKPNLYKKQLSEFKTQMNCFLMDILTNICFNNQFDSKLPDKQVLESLMKLLLPKPISQNIDSKMHENEITTLFDLDLNPSLKSTLFQLILNNYQENVEQHLDEILSKSKAYLESSYNDFDLANLKLIYINSIEDNFHSICAKAGNQTYEIELAIEFLGNDLENLDDVNCMESLQPVESLKLIAEIKFSLCALAKLVIDFDVKNKNHVTLLKSCRKLIEKNDSNCVWLRFYLIKNIFRRYGKAELVKLCKSKSFDWILPDQLLSNVISRL